MADDPFVLGGTSFTSRLIMGTGAAPSLEVLERALSSGAKQIVGVTQFVDPDPLPTTVEPDPAASAPGGGDTCTAATTSCCWRRLSSTRQCMK